MNPFTVLVGRPFWVHPAPYATMFSSIASPRCLNDHCLVGGIPTPLKMWKSIRMIIPNIWETKVMFQTTNQPWVEGQETRVGRFMVAEKPIKSPFSKMVPIFELLQISPPMPSPCTVPRAVAQRWPPSAHLAGGTQQHASDPCPRPVWKPHASLHHQQCEHFPGGALNTAMIRYMLRVYLAKVFGGYRYCL